MDSNVQYYNYFTIDESMIFYLNYLIWHYPDMLSAQVHYEWLLICGEHFIQYIFSMISVNLGLFFFILLQYSKQQTMSNYFVEKNDAETG